MPAMRRPDRRLLLATAAGAGALALWMAFLAALVGSTLEDDQRAALARWLGPRLPLFVLAWAIAVGLLAALLQRWLRRYALAPARLAEGVRALLRAPEAVPLATEAGREFQALAVAIGELAAQRDALRRDVAAQVLQANAGLQQERNRLAALMSELTQSVVVCSLDGRVVLCNNRARLQLRALSPAPHASGGAGPTGIGRSIYGVFDRALVAHALDSIRARLARGAAHPSAQFVTATAGGQLLRVQMAPVRTGADAAGDAIGGFVLVLDNITRGFEEDVARDQLLHALTEGGRSSLASLQAALDVLGLPGLDPATRERFLGVVREEAAALGRCIAEADRQATRGLKTRWPLEDMLGADLAGVACRRIEALCGRPVAADEVDAALWLRVDSFALLQALVSLAGRLVDEFGVRHLRLRLRRAGARAQLDLVWTGQAVSTETMVSWEMEPMRVDARSTPLSVRDVVERHGGEIWFERDRARHEAFFRFLLPAAGEGGPPEAAEPGAQESRPEFYDFDLFATDTGAGALDDRPLSRLAFTVFDTETTGLQPSAGDRIIQLGAVRIVNGRLLRHECFEQLVDPGRTIPAASIPIHGITQDMVAGKPRIAEVLPAFHAFAQDTVLVAHNAAFDMKFLQLQEQATGIAFRQPVLDTLLLSAVAQPSQDSHRLEDIAQRLGVPVLGRHTALGDALVTAEVLLRLIPLLEAQGIRTLRQARDAAQKTWYARLEY
jgi:DNA polymerase-3 subunit epsilon